MHVITGLGTGGAERQMANLVAAMMADGCADMTVVSLMPGGYYRDQLERLGVCVVDLGFGRMWPNPLGFLRLVRHIRKRKPSVIQSWMYHADIIALVALLVSGYRKRTRMFWGVRCSDMDLTGSNLRLGLMVRLCASLSHLPDAIIFNSSSGYDVHVGRGYKPRAWHHIDNGIDTTQFAPNIEARARMRKKLGIRADAFVAVTLARMHPMKDYPTLISAMQRIPEIKCVVAGKDTELIDGPENLILLGERHDIADVLSAADVMVSSSAYGEGFSNAIAEAMAVGLVIVATDVGDSARLVDKCGKIVPARDPRAIEAALRELFASGETIKQLSSHARHRVKKYFSIGAMASKYKEVYFG